MSVDPFDLFDEGFIIVDEEQEERRRKEAVELVEDEFYDFGEDDWEWETDEDEW
jgi:hypothetical protein